MATTFQIEYWKQKESERSNREKERETARSNQAQERETKRSNMAREEETRRSNFANEMIGRDKNTITQQHNRDTVSVARGELSNKQYQTTIQRQELERKQRADAETIRHNKETELSSLLGAGAGGVGAISKLINSIK